jgi:hypothetical protein
MSQYIFRLIIQSVQSEKTRSIRQHFFRQYQKSVGLTAVSKTLVLEAKNQHDLLCVLWLY